MTGSTREERVRKPEASISPPQSLLLFIINLHNFTFSLTRSTEGKHRRPLKVYKNCWLKLTVKMLCQVENGIKIFNLVS